MIWCDVNCVHLLMMICKVSVETLQSVVSNVHAAWRHLTGEDNRTTLLQQQAVHSKRDEWWKWARFAWCQLFCKASGELDVNLSKVRNQTVTQINSSISACRRKAFWKVGNKIINSDLSRSWMKATRSFDERSTNTLSVSMYNWQTYCWCILRGAFWDVMSRS